MATVKKRKVDAECRLFQEKWTNDFFFVEVKGKPVCLVCGEALAVMKKANLERHYSTKHAKLNELKGQMRVDKVNALRRSLEAQQAAFIRPCTDRENITRASFVVSELIATKLKPHAEGEFVKECLVAAAEVLAPDKLNNVMKTVVSTINFIKSRGLNNRQFKELLSELESEYGDLVYHCEVQWLSRANMLARFYTLREEVKHFMEMKGKPVMELSDGKFLSDLAFMVDITKHLSELNIKLQGPNQLVSSLLSNVKTFEVKLRLWQGQLERGNTVHFPTLQEQKPDVMTEYAGECAKLVQAFDERFHDVKNIQRELDMFATPFNVHPSDVPDKFQMEIIELQNNNELKAKYNDLSLLDFYKLYISAEDFPILRRHALKFASLFGTTYGCEQFFSKLTLAKTLFRSRLTDPNLENQLRVASSSLPADIRCLSKEKQFHPSH
ncbi:Protein ZBED8 [Takifugu flavidus]|uniref:Protein ZBED8 n=1 Tax=Takifugu flavidus TaxID=433684 RepID=A0A5C6NR51_9TELE|nr:Protein ZBED8 [Takifugu flavidus]